MTDEWCADPYHSQMEAWAWAINDLLYWVGPVRLHLFGKGPDGMEMHCGKWSCSGSVSEVQREAVRLAKAVRGQTTERIQQILERESPQEPENLRDPRGWP